MKSFCGCFTGSKDGRWEVKKVMRQTMVETTTNEKLLQGVQGDGFLEKSPPGRRRQRSINIVF
jgi:hypothetical protein